MIIDVSAHIQLSACELVGGINHKICDKQPVRCKCMVTFIALENHRSFTSAKLCCLFTEACASALLYSTTAQWMIS